MAIIQGIFTEKQILPYEAWTNNPDFLLEVGEYFVDNYLKAEGVTGGIAYVKATDGNLFFSYDTTTTLEDLETFNHSMYFIYSMATGFDKAPGNRIPLILKNGRTRISLFLIG